MKQFYGSISFSGSIDFYVEAENEEEAREIVTNDIEGLDISIKEGSPVEIPQIDWELITEAPKGNVSAPFIYDMEIYEEG
ncbi:MAG: hypothetical protein M0Q88_03095 [Bacilli bacterium]|nr:hypothetical protein [Bacilli bacterium]